MQPNSSPGAPATAPLRITSIDALRGFIMFMMIFVNDLAGAGKVVPDWMVHFSDRHKGGSGMTFVDLVFPVFLFIVGMSIPMALGGRIAKGQSMWRILGHIAIRTLSLISIGILMVHETPDSAGMGWSGAWWCVAMYTAAIFAFCSFSPISLRQGDAANKWRVASACARAAGVAALIWLAFAFRGANGERIITLSPFSIRTQWYGILGLIGWAYLVACVVFLVFRTNRTAILACMALLLCLFGAERSGVFEGFWLNHIVGIGGTLGSLGGISVGGLLLGAMLADTTMTGLRERTKFTFWFAAGCAAAALLLTRTYGISKNSATPPWCLWSCAITALLWFVFLLITDVRPVKSVSKPFALAGQNVLLAYLISDLLPSLISAMDLNSAYGSLAATLPSAIARSAICGAVILVVSTLLNRIGFRLKL